MDIIFAIMDAFIELFGDIIPFVIGAIVILIVIIIIGNIIEKVSDHKKHLKDIKEKCEWESNKKLSRQIRHYLSTGQVPSDYYSESNELVRELKRKLLHEIHNGEDIKIDGEVIRYVGFGTIRICDYRNRTALLGAGFQYVLGVESLGQDVNDCLVYAYIKIKCR